MELKGTIIQEGKVEKVSNRVTFSDEHPKTKKITCSLFELGKTGLPLYIRMATGKNMGMCRSLANQGDRGIYATPEFPNPFEVGDEYIILTMT